MPKSELDEGDIIEFEKIEDFVATIQMRLRTLEKFRKKAKTKAEQEEYAGRIEEVNGFVDLVQCSNLDIKQRGYKKSSKAIEDILAPRTNGLATTPKKAAKGSSRTAKLTIGREPNPNSKKAQILNYIRGNPKVTAAQVAAALGFEGNSVSAHIFALGVQQLIEKKDGLWKAKGH